MRYIVEEDIKAGSVVELNPATGMLRQADEPVATKLQLEINRIEKIIDFERAYHSIIAAFAIHCLELLIEKANIALFERDEIKIQEMYKQLRKIEIVEPISLALGEDTKF